MSGSFDAQGKLEISDGRLIFLTGRKKSGKSVLAKLIFQSYPGDRVIIDPAGDDGPFGPGVIELKGTKDTLPDVWPEWMREYDKNEQPIPMTLRYFPDAGSDTFLADVDKVVGMALDHSDRLKKKGELGVLLLIHEIGDVCPPHRTQPNMRRILAHNRHHGLSMVSCGPRPVAIDTLVLQQADLIYIFEQRNPDDRERLAKTVGWPLREFDLALNSLQPHEYLRSDANEPQPPAGQEDLRLVKFPPLPPDALKRADRPISREGN